MTTTINILGLVIALLFTHLPVAANEIYQWTDLAGNVHFTDNLSLVPESIRHSRRMVVRKDLALTEPSISAPEMTRSQESFPQAPQAPALEPERHQTAPATVVVVPQETTIVVVNSRGRHIKRHPCQAGANCPPVFRPDFNDRRYIHPSVFHPGGSRQYIDRR